MRKRCIKLPSSAALKRKCKKLPRRSVALSEAFPASYPAHQPCAYTPPVLGLLSSKTIQKVKSVQKMGQAVVVVEKTRTICSLLGEDLERIGLHVFVLQTQLGKVGLDFAVDREGLRGFILLGGRLVLSLGLLFLLLAGSLTCSSGSRSAHWFFRRRRCRARSLGAARRRRGWRRCRSQAGALGLWVGLAE